MGKNKGYKLSHKNDILLFKDKPILIESYVGEDMAVMTQDNILVNPHTYANLLKEYMEIKEERRIKNKTRLGKALYGK